ncbi:DUF1156 domain-containing protein, partial [Synechococcus sp. H55.4]|uniref:DUF1156 domain-containing protein n=1 Tax=Synechococcus sp. H55.4 TaxID=2964506 RepID=UPI0039C1122B
MSRRKKLIEVALPLEAINLESAREKSIRHGHPSTLHLWWARRPLAACRAVLWASLVDDPSSWPDRFPTEADQERERQRLLDILARIEVQKDKDGKTKQVVRGLVSWDDVNDPNSGVLEAAQREIARCLAWDRGEDPPTDPQAVREYIAKHAPPVYDPFAGGGSIPLEAQRLGLKAYASDLNPVAVLINKALIEIPPLFKDKPPINPQDRPHPPTPSPIGRDCPHPPAPSPIGRDGPHPPTPSPIGRGGVCGLNRWYGAQGLAADVRYYGQWMRDEAFKRIGHLYPKIALTPQPPLLWGEGEKTQNPLPLGEGRVRDPSVVHLAQGQLPNGDVALTPQPPLLWGGMALTPQPPLPQGEGELEKWEVPPAIQKKMQEVARQLRRQSTPSEAILWEALRNRQLEGRKFRRQHPIGTFVVDFFCKEEALIVEVDGPIHEHQKDLDRQRQELLESLGLRFVRLSSHLVETNLPVALDRIRAAFRPLPPSPPGRGDGGEGKLPPGRGDGGEGKLPSGKGQGEGEATVIAWLWARTVKCPNPACGCQMPLVRSFQLSTKKGKEAWVEPVIERLDALTPQPPLPQGDAALTPRPPLPQGDAALTPQPPLPKGEGERTQNPLPLGEGRV